MAFARRHHSPGVVNTRWHSGLAVEHYIKLNLLKFYLSFSSLFSRFVIACSRFMLNSCFTCWTTINQTCKVTFEELKILQPTSETCLVYSVSKHTKFEDLYFRQTWSNVHNNQHTLENFVLVLLILFSSEMQRRKMTQFMRHFVNNGSLHKNNGFGLDLTLVLVLICINF